MPESIMPEIDLFPRVHRVIQAVKRIAMLGAVTEPSLSEHPSTGAAAMLDASLRQEASDY